MRRPADRTPRPEAPPPTLDVVHAGVTYRIAVKRVGTARRFTLRVRAATHDAVLTMPLRASFKTARAFAERHAEWVSQRLSVLPQPIVIAAGSTLPLRGRTHWIERRQGLRATAWVETPAEGEAAILCVAGREAAFGKILLAFLRREAAKDFASRVAVHTAAVGRPCSRVSLRDTRSRWGSCSSRGTLSFSWRLILAPSFVLDYLVAHEVAHLVHMNHSDAFWQVTRRLAPATDAAEAWLKANGASLHRYSFGEAGER